MASGCNSSFRAIGHLLVLLYISLCTVSGVSSSHQAPIQTEYPLLLLLAKAPAPRMLKSAARPRISAPRMQYGQQQYGNGQQYAYGQQPQDGNGQHHSSGQQQQYVEAVSAYQANRNDELTVYPGDIISVVEQGEDGWWKGTIDGFTGYFPSSCCTAPSSGGAGAQGGAATSMQATVLYTYEATKDDELSLYPGDIIHDVVQAEQKWWTGVLRGQKGWFPADAVELMRVDAGPTNAGRSQRDQDDIEHISKELGEPQVRIVRAVVDALGAETAFDLLDMTKQIQAQGGMIIPDTGTGGINIGKRRTNGGVFLQLLKDANNLPRQAQEAALQRIKIEGKKVKSWEKAA